MNIMPLENIPDWEKRVARSEAFWKKEIIDRPAISAIVRKEKPVFIPQIKPWKNHRERWLDIDHLAENALAHIHNNYFLGDALPQVLPILGPEVFSSFFGAPLEFSETTSWSIPNLHSWSEVDKIRFSEDNDYWRILVKMTDRLLDVGKGKFYTGITDIHPGGDAIAAFRDPLNFNLDMIEARDEVKKLLAVVTKAYFHMFDTFCDKLQAANQPICSWAGMVSAKRWYIPSNDFSCMISSEAFDDVFLPGLREECRHMDYSIYHLDGPGAIHHLESLLTIPELTAIQWVFTAGVGRASDSIELYQRCQAAGKGVQINMAPDEVDVFMRSLRPEGVWVRLMARSRAEAEESIRTLSRWT